MSIPIIIALATAAVVVAIVLLSRKAERARTEALQQASVTLGFNFEAEGDLDQMRALGEMPLYGHGHSKKVRNVMSGRSGDAEVRVFDYQYTVGGGKESHTHTQTIVLYPRGGQGLPDFVLAPENVFHKLGQLLGYRDIDFDANPVFSSRYLLRGPDEMAIRSAFTADALMFFEQQPGWTVEVQAGNVAVYRADQRARPEEVATLANKAQEVLRAIARR